MNSPSTPVRLAVIGCGRIAQVAHLPAIAKSDQVELVAVSDPSAALRDGVGHRYDVTAYATTEELLARAACDAVVVAVPDRLHLELGRAALESGRHLLVEKPATATSEEALELERVADKTGLVVQIGAMRRHDPGVRYASRALADIGSVLTAVLWYRLPSGLRATTEQALFPPIVVDEDVRSHEAAFKADRPAYLLRTHGAHVFDTARLMFGAARSVRAELASAERDLSWSGTITCAAAPVRFEITANAHTDYSEGIDVFGSAGAISVRSFFPFYRRASVTRVFREENSEWTTREFGAVDPYQRQVEAFAEAVRSGGHADPDARDGLEALRLIEATRDSCAAGESVAL